MIIFHLNIEDRLFCICFGDVKLAAKMQSTRIYGWPMCLPVIALQSRLTRSKSATTTQDRSGVFKWWKATKNNKDNFFFVVGMQIKHPTDNDTQKEPGRHYSVTLDLWAIPPHLVPSSKERKTCLSLCFIIIVMQKKVLQFNGPLVPPHPSKQRRQLALNNNYPGNLKIF